MYNLVLDNCGCIEKDENIRGVAPLILILGTVSITLQSLYPPDRNPPLLIVEMLCGLQSPSEGSGIQNCLLSLPGFESRTFQLVAWSLYRLSGGKY